MNYLLIFWFSELLIQIVGILQLMMIIPFNNIIIENTFSLQLGISDPLNSSSDDSLKDNSFILSFYCTLTIPKSITSSFSRILCEYL